ncbi:ABC transporter permease [Pseudonocardia ailaonensis]|uniref:ABC transporter permease n=1 Tax=Pseudonocardia ailaonensis TaxID=367279 RepID=UPI0031E2A81A
MRTGALDVVRRPGLVLALVVLVVVISWAFVPGLFAHQDPITGVPADRLQGPSAAHLFGTDHLGRDTFSRVVHGASLTLRATLLAVLVGLAAGGLLGLVAGFVGGRLDAVVMRVVDVMLAIPGLLLSLAVVTALGFGTLQVAIAVGVSSVAAFARVMRAETLRVRAQTFVEAAHSVGSRRFYVLAAHVLPNASGPVLALSALEFGSAILSISSLSFLGFGAQPPAPEWGALVSDGRDYLGTAWWLTTFPGLTVALVVLAANRLARHLEGTRE